MSPGPIELETIAALEHRAALEAAPTLPALAVELELLADRMLRVDLELAGWRADLTPTGRTPS